MYKLNVPTVVLTIAMLLIVSPAAAEDYIWSGGDLGVWTADANWSPVGTPGAGDTAALNTSNTVDWMQNITTSGISTFTQTAGTIVGGGSEFRPKGNKTIDLSGGLFDATRGFEIGDENGGAVNINVSGSSEVRLHYSRDVWAPVMAIGGRGGTGIVTISGGSVIVYESSNNDWDDIRISRDRYGDSSGTLTLSGGRLDLGGKNIVMTDNTTTSEFNFTGGRLENVDNYFRTKSNRQNGNPETFEKVSATLAQFDGVLAPGTVRYTGADTGRTVEPVGTTTIFGSYNQSALGTLEIDIAGLASFDKVLVNEVDGAGGTAELFGAVDVNLLGAVLPGFSYDVVTASTSLDITGLTVTDGWTASVVNGNTLRLTGGPSAPTYDFSSTWTEAADGAWGGAGAGADLNWTETGGSANTAPGVYGTKEQAIFDTVAAPSVTATLDGAAPNLASLKFQGATAYTIAQGTGGAIAMEAPNTEVLATVNVDGASSHRIDAPVTLTGDTSVNTAASASRIEVSGAIDGAGALIKTGDGTLVLSGDNSYTGLTAIFGGTIDIASTGKLGGGVYAPDVTIASGAELTLNNANLQEFTGTVDVSGTLTVQGSGQTNIYATGNPGSTNITGAGTIIKGGSGVLRVSPPGGGGGTYVHSFTGDIWVKDGILYGSKTTFGIDNASSITLGDTGATGVLEYARDYTAALNMPITLIGGGGGINVSNKSGKLTLAGDIDGDADLEKVGQGALKLTGDNTYTGTTTVTGGTLRLSGSLANSNITITGGDFIGDSGTIAYNMGSSPDIITMTGGTLDISALTIDFAGSADLDEYVLADYSAGGTLTTTLNPATGDTFFDAANVPANYYFFNDTDNGKIVLFLADNFSSIADSAWDIGATWDMDPLTPGVKSRVTVDDSDTVTVGGVQMAHELQIVDSGALQIDGALAVTTGVTVAGDAGLVVSGTLDAKDLDTTGTMTMSGGGTIPTIYVSGGQTTFESGSSPVITTLNASGGITTFASGSGGTFVAINVSDGETTFESASAPDITTLTTTGGTTTFESGSLGTVGTIYVSGGTVTMSSPTVTTVNVDDAASILNYNGTQTENLAVSDGTVNTGVGAGVVNATFSGGVVNTQGNTLTVTNTADFAGLDISVTGGTFGLIGADLANEGTPHTVTLNGGVTTITAASGGGQVPTGFDAYYSFEDPDNLGNDDSENSYNMSDQDSPGQGDGILDGKALSVGNNSGLKINSPFYINRISDRTWAFWVDPNTAAGDNHVIFEEGGGTNGVQFDIDSDGLLDFHVRNGGSGPTISSTTNVLSAGEFVHVLGVFDHGQMRLYINGAEESSDSAGFAEIGDHSSQTAIGSTVNGPPENSSGAFDGLIDDFYVWDDQALTPEEVLQTYRAGLPSGSSLTNTTLTATTTSEVAIDTDALELGGITTAASTTLTVNSQAATIAMTNMTLGGGSMVKSTRAASSDDVDVTLSGTLNAGGGKSYLRSRRGGNRRRRRHVLHQPGAGKRRSGRAQSRLQLDVCIGRGDRRRRRRDDGGDRRPRTRLRSVGDGRRTDDTTRRRRRKQHRRRGRRDVLVDNGRDDRRRGPGRRRSVDARGSR